MSTSRSGWVWIYEPRFGNTNFCFQYTRSGFLNNIYKKGHSYLTNEIQKLNKCNNNDKSTLLVDALSVATRPYWFVIFFLKPT